MAVTRITYECDWPDCKAKTSSSRYTMPIFWESRCGDEMVVCPEHRFKTSRQLEEAIRQKWDEEAFEEKWGFLL